MSKVLVSCFSASGVTKGVAEKVANAINGDLFEIEPVEKLLIDVILLMILQMLLSY